MEDEYLQILPEPKDIQVVVLMGGLGTRLGDESRMCPKSLMDINGRAFFDYQLKLMTDYGFCKFLFLVGYKAYMIEEHYGDGSSFEVSITYSYDGEKPLGTGGAIRNAYELLEDDFLLIYGDSFMDIDYKETIYRYFNGKLQGCHALMTVMENNDHLDESNVIYENDTIILYDKRNRDKRMHYIDYGIGLYEKGLFKGVKFGASFDIALLQNELSIAGKLSVHEVANRFYEIGSKASLDKFRQYAKERFENEGKAIFFDRDGVVNEIVFRDETGQLDSPLNTNELFLVDGIVESMRELQKEGYYLFIVTNQPAAAKGKVRLGQLFDINTVLCKRLKAYGIQIEAVEICPHYPQMSKSVKESFLIRQCQCRKPKTGMIDAICKRFQINKETSWMVGDSYTDVIAGRQAGLRTVFLGNFKCDACKKLNYIKPDLICKKVLDLPDYITGREL